MRRLLGLVAMITLAASIGSSGSADAEHTAGARPLARLHLELNTTANWTRVDFVGTTIRAHRIVEHPQSARAWVRQSGIQMDDPGTTVIDVVAELPDVESIDVVIDKGRNGAATLALSNVEGVVAELHNDRNVPIDASKRWTLATTDLIPPGTVVPRHRAAPLVLAQYYPWFESSDDRSRWADEPISYYDTTDQAHVAGMIAEAAGAGINGFFVNWRGEQHGPQLDLVMDEADGRGDFLVGIALDLAGLRDAEEASAADEPLLAGTTSLLSGDDEQAASEGEVDLAGAELALRQYLERADRPSVLEVDGRPVVNVFGTFLLSPNQWNEFRSRFAGSHPFFVGDNFDPRYQLEGSYYYNPNRWGPAKLRKKYRFAEKRSHLEPWLDPVRDTRLWAATVSPGYDDRRARDLGWSRHRGGGSVYDETWAAAQETGADWVLVTSWNEWYEGTHISPSRLHGTRALDQTRTWAAHFAPLGFG